MLENKILLNQKVSESKRDAITNQLDKNSTDRKFEDAMVQSRQQQLNSEQRQNAAKNDHAQQQQRQQQEQIKARQQSERKSDQTEQPKNKTVNGTKTVGHAEKDTNVNEKVIDKNIEKDVKIETSSAVTTSDLKDNNVKVKETDVDSTSWLDTFMKIVATNEQKTNAPTSNEIITTDSVGKDVAETNITDKDVIKMANVDLIGQEKTVSDDVLTNLLFGTDQTTTQKVTTDAENGTPTELLAESVKQVDDVTSLLTDKVLTEVAEKGGVLESKDGKVVGGESTELHNIISTLLKGADKSSANNDEAETPLTSSSDDQSQILIKADGVNSPAVEINKVSKVADDNASVTQKSTPIIASSTLQQQIQQQNIENNIQPNLLEQNTKSNKVLNFVNPAVSQQNNVKSTDSVDNYKFVTNAEEESDALKTNADSSNVNERKLDSELRATLDIRNASLVMNNIEASTKVVESFNKTDVVDVNGVQLDKTLQLPKLEQSSQAKNETLLRENILFNKQEMATHMQQQIGIMMSKNMKSIDIRLDPPELGAMQIKLTMNNDQAAVSFVVSNQQAKEALEASLPKLRELLEQQGMDLSESDVQHGSAQDETGSQDDSEARNNGNVMSNDEGQDEATMIAQEKLNRAINSPWNVDYYA